MQKFPFLVGLFLAAPLTAILFLANRLINLPFPPWWLFDRLVRLLPGPLVTRAIDGLTGLLLGVGVDPSVGAKPVKQGLALLLFLLIGGIIGWAVGQVWPWSQQVERLDRRRFLLRMGAASATITVLGAGLATKLILDERRRIDQALRAALAASGRFSTATGDGRPLPNADDPVLPAPGSRPEYTPLKDHYKVFLNTWPEEIDEAGWRLRITGQVARPLTLSLNDLRSQFTPVERFITLRCVSGRLGDHLISTTLWRGCLLADVLAAASVHPSARYAYFTSSDGYYESVPLETVSQDGRLMLCYEMDGLPLRSFHGFPLRLWIPDVYGMKQPKWITGIELTDEKRPGYWVERSWDEQAQVKALSVVDRVAVKASFSRDGQRFVPVGGFAYAGDRSISQVQVRVDGGDWQPTRLRTPLSDTTWTLWRYDWPFTPGEHTFEVRCVDGDGQPQIEESHPPHPDGAAGIHGKTVDT